MTTRKDARKTGKIIYSVALSARCRSPPKHLPVDDLTASLPQKGQKITVITKIVEKIAKITENTKMLEYSTK